MKYLQVGFYLLWPILVFGQKSFSWELLSQLEHPFETNDVWGYVDEDGSEYAVVGTERDCRIYNLSNPSDPELLTIIDGARSIWRDFKSYDKYIYQITQRGSDGLTIIDMSKAPDTITSKLYKPSITIGETTEVLSTCHNIWIDTDRGIAYLAGCNPGRGGILMFDLTMDPLNPDHIGTIDDRYSHDVITKGDTVFSAEINEGNLAFYNISDLRHPELYSRIKTSSSFTHNAWYSDDGNYVFTTDERPNATIDAYDITDIFNPTRVDRFQPVVDEGVIPHNTHYHDGFLFTAWYVEGLVVVDAHRPDNLVQVGQFKTYNGTRSGFEGAWGVYPFLPSGLILVSDLAGGLFVLHPTHDRAAYLEGEIVDFASGIPINGAEIRINTQISTQEISNALGEYKTGIADDGLIEVVVNHPDYLIDTVTFNFIKGEVIQHDFKLISRSSVLTIAGVIKDEAGQPIENAAVKMSLLDSDRTFEESTDLNGNYQMRLPIGSYEFLVGAWGYKGKLIRQNVSSALQEDIILEAGYEDDFFADLGWVISSDATTGAWIRDTPKATFLDGLAVNPGKDVDDDLGDHAYVTGNNNASVGADDVDRGTTSLTSPAIDVSNLKNAIIELTPWFYNGGGDNTPNDTMKIYLVHHENDRTITHIFTDTSRQAGRWQEPIRIFVDSIYKRAKQVKIEVVVSDHDGSGHLVEAAIDRFRMYEGPLTQYPVNQERIEVILSPNPSSGLVYIEPKSDHAIVKMRIFDMTGRIVFERNTPPGEMSFEFLNPGEYIFEFLFSNSVKSASKWIKI